MALRQGPGYFRIRSIGDVPKLINVTELANLHPAADPQQISTMSFLQMHQEGAKRIAEGFTKNDPGLVTEGQHLIDTAVYMFFGGSNYLTAATTPPYADFLPAGVDCYLANAKTIREVVPAVAVMIDDDDIKRKREHLGWLQLLTKRRAPIIKGYGMIQSHLEQDLHGSMSRVYSMGQQAMSTDLVLSENMQDFNKIFTTGPQESLDSRKNNEKVADNARDNTVEDAKKVVAEALKQAPQTPGQPQLQVNLDSLKSDRNRNRGNHRDG